MNPCIGDRQLDPPEDGDPDDRETCEYCEGSGSTNPSWTDPLGDECPACFGSGLKLTPDLSDPGEPNEDPE